MADDMVPRATLVAVAESFNALKVLERQRAATQAKMIRSCLAAIRMDVQTYGTHKYPRYSQAWKNQIQKNKDDQKKGCIYLEVLATMLEDQAHTTDLSDNPTTSIEGESPCTAE